MVGVQVFTGGGTRMKETMRVSGEILAPRDTHYKCYLPKENVTETNANNTDIILSNALVRLGIVKRGGRPRQKKTKV